MSKYEKWNERFDLMIKGFVYLVVALLLVLMIIAFSNMVYHGVVDGWASLE